MTLRQRKAFIAMRKLGYTFVDALRFSKYVH